MFPLYSYTEAEKVQKEVRRLERKEEEKFLRDRHQKIKVQIYHMEHKHKLEQLALSKKLQTTLQEQDKIRKVEQANMLQRFMN